MGVSVRKGHEMSQREELLLDVALSVVEESGFSKLTMDKLVKQSGFSKGTIYNHFASKEDLFSALSLRSIRIQLGLYSRIFAMAGGSREKLVVMAMAYRLFSQLYPTLYQVVLSSKMRSVAEKVSAERACVMSESENKLVAVITQLVKQGGANKELTFDRNLQPDEVTFAVWSMAFGTNVLMETVGQVSNVTCLDVSEGDRAMFLNINLICDGLGWLPLSRDKDYWAIWQQNSQLLFQSELDQLNGQQL
ncbi:TetR/AcrR family transcriptional regulator [Corallincola luteus]|uniref:TetR/AcrR family transcriptional regulator n=1 Tax=Corallincola luteus TaxID=1775177 RepID=A0ABY2ALE9_9GAMM|nr:TetR/AcrR family transcriptional regulator [Corallincola luteus]TCI03747.1 TetR/AcrR family transcriptional regulator [Corallincola luteus]